MFDFCPSLLCLGVSDAGNVEKLHFELTKIGYRVFWDKLCLEAGKDWEEGFCTGVVQSRVFVPVVSGKGLYSGKSWADISKLTPKSKCDNVVLEYQLALELRDRTLIEHILPVTRAQFSTERWLF